MSSFADITIAKRYARALFEALAPASFRDALGQLKTLGQAVSTVTLALSHPSVSSVQKAQLLWTALKQVNPNAQPQLEGLLLALAENKRVGILPAVAASFEGIVEAFEKLTRVKVISAQQLSSEEQEAILQRVRGSFAALEQQGVVPVVEFLVDASLLGGLKITLADKELDASLAGAFERLQGALQD